MSLLTRRLLAHPRSHTLTHTAARSHKLPTSSYQLTVKPFHLRHSHQTTSVIRTMSSSGSMMEKDVGAVSDFKLNIPTEVEIGEIKAIVVKTEDGLFALGNKCTHYGAPLSKGIVAGGRVKCPWHGACFRVATGDIEEAPAPAALPTYKVRTEGDRVFVSADQKSEEAKNSKVLPPSAIDGTAQSHNDTTHKPIKGTENQHFVVVGGGSGGQSAVDSLREFGFMGKLTLVSAEKTLPYDRTKLSKQPMVDKSSIAIRNSQYYQDRKIDVHLGTEVKSIDPPGNSIALSNGNTIKYDKLFIATGGTPVTGMFPGDDLRNVYTLRVPEDADKIIQAIKSKPNCKVHIVGSGWIGVELAGALQTQKNDKKLEIDGITVINMQDMPFKAVVGPRIGAEIMKWHESKGVKFMTETKTKKLEGEDGAVKKVHVEDKDGKASALETDVVISAVGVKPNTQFLKNAQGIELEEKTNAVYVNENLQTSVRNIYAYGDIAKFPYDKISKPEAIRIEHWNVAMQHGRIAAAHALNNESVMMRTTHSYVPWFWSMQYGNSIRYVGHSEKYDDIIYSGTVEDEHKFVAYYVQGDQVEAMLTWQRDPMAAAGSELFMRKLMPSASELKKNPDMDLQELLKSKASNSTKEPQPK